MRYQDASGRPTSGEGQDTSALVTARRAHRLADWSGAMELYAAGFGGAQSIDAAINFGFCALQRGSIHLARGAFESARAAEDARALRDVALGLAILGDLESSLSLYLQALPRLDDSVGATLSACRVALELGDRTSALDLAEAATVAAPNEASTWHWLFRVTGDLLHAERCFALDPSWHWGVWTFGGALAVTGDRSALTRFLAQGALSATSVRALEWVASVGPVRAFRSKRETLHFACDLARRHGPALEFGVRYGISTRLLAHRFAGVVGFDSFEGLPTRWCGLTERALSVGGDLPDVPANVTLVKGWFEETLPAYLEAAHEPPSLVHIDSDLYESARLVLGQLGSTLTSGTVLIFDEFLGNPSWEADEAKAFFEAVDRFGWRPTVEAVSPSTGQIVVRL